MNTTKFCYLIFSPILAVISLNSAATKPTMPIQSLHSIQTVVGSQAPYSPLLSKTDLAAQLLNNQNSYKSTKTNWHQSAHIKVPGSIEIFKFQNYYQDLPIMGDWAIITFDQLGQPLTVESSSSFIDEKSHQTFKAAWPVTESAIMKQFKNVTNIQRMWLKSEQELTPVYFINQLENIKQQPRLSAIIVDANTGKELIKRSLTHDLSFNYKVYALPDGSTPADSVFGSTQPHPTGMPDDIQPTVFADQIMIGVESTSITNDPWLEATATETLGNHVDVFFNSLLLPDGTYDDLFSEAGAWGPEFQAEDGDFRAQLTSPNTFDYTYNPSISADDFYQLPSDPVPSNPSPADPQINSKLVQAFYMANTVHDVFYDAGFTETAGNAQHDNYDRGGIENDRMLIHGNCVSTFIFTPEDGISPVMCLGRNGYSSSQKDASFDYSTFAHEWTHYMYKRLVQGPTLPFGNQGRSLNEGWADLIGIFMTVDEADVSTPISAGFNSTYSVGSYFNTDYNGMPYFDPLGPDPDAHFYGIRRWPYGYSNPFTFKHIEHKQPLPANYDYFDWKGRSKFNSEVHTAGEVWAAAVWDCFRGIFANRTDRTFSQNRNAMASYVVGGMAATPPDPTFLEARNGLLFALHNTDETDWQTCRLAFTNRGMGSGAIAPDRNSKTHLGVVESFINEDLTLSVIKSSLVDDLVSFDNDNILDQFETGNLSLTLKNTGFVAIDLAIIELISDADFQFDPTPNEFFDIPVGGEIEVNIPIKLLHDKQYDQTTFTAVIPLIADNGNTTGGGDTVLKFRTHYNVSSSDDDVETLDYEDSMQLWQQYPLNGSELYYLHMDTAFIRSELPGSTNVVLKISEEYSSFDQAMVSPWMQLDAASPQFSMSMDHSYVLGDMGQIAQVQYSFDDENWLPMINQSNQPADFFGSNTSYPALDLDSFSIVDFQGNTAFKIRFHINAFFNYSADPAIWVIDNLRLNNITSQPFLAVSPQSSNDLIYQDGFE